MPRLPDIIVRNFNHGLVNRVEPESIKRGAASDSLNWLSYGDRIELRGGYKVTGTEVSGVGKITGMKVGARFDGTQVPFFSYGRKLNYYDADSDATVEIGTNTLPEDADGEDVAFDTYHSLAGAFMYASSPSSSIYKIPIANPGSVVDQNSTSHRGRIFIKQARTFLVNRKDADGGFDATGLYLSYIDKDELSDYTETTSEAAGSGDGATKNFTGTLTNVTGVKTCMYVRITDGTETFTDDRNGNLDGNLGGTGTINYATGAYDVTFETAPANGTNNITADYYTEDSTSQGIVDFSKSTPRTAGQGATFRQDDGGAEAQFVASLGSDEYVFHVTKTWRVTLSSDDTAATNLIYRARVGIESWRAAEETGDGIYYVDSQDADEAEIRLLRLGQFSDQVIPESISEQLDLSQYRFDLGFVSAWQEYIVVGCRTKDSTINNRMLFYNKRWGLWDVTDFRGNMVDEFNSSLLAGDSGSNNVFTLFSGVSDEDANIPNFWISGNDNLDRDGMKIFNRMMVSGDIGKEQEIDVDASFDGGSFVNLFTIDGKASYVSAGASKLIGSSTIGSTEVGGGTTGVEVSPFTVEFQVNSEKFERVRIRFKATKVGGAIITEYQFKDVRYKGRDVLPVHTAS